MADKVKAKKVVKVWFVDSNAEWQELETKEPLHELNEAVKLVKEFPTGTEYRIFTVLKFGTVQEVVTKKVTI